MPERDYERFMELREKTERAYRAALPADLAAVTPPLGPRPRCRHFEGGTEDCIPACLLVFGDTFHEAVHRD